MVHKQGTRKRTMVGSNGLLQKYIDTPAPRAAAAALRQGFAEKAKATASEIKAGRSGIYTRSFAARKCTPSKEICDKVDNAYVVLHTYMPGSVARALLSIHCLGFRVFPKAGATTSFICSQKIEVENSILKNQANNTDLKLNGLNVNSLFDALTTPMRSKGDNTDVGPLVTRFYSCLTNKPFSKKSIGAEVDLCVQLAETLVEKYETWKELFDDPQESYEAVRGVFNDIGISVDLVGAFNVLIEANEKEGDLKYSTVAFDNTFQRIDYNADPAFILMALTARYGQRAYHLDLNVGKHVKESITTTNANGLGWLFNKGRKLLCAASDEELMDFVGTDRNNPALVEMLDILSGIKAPDLFEKDVIPDARSECQGMIDSATSNHVVRLNSSLDVLMQTTADEIQALTDELRELADEIRELQGVKNLFDNLNTLWLTVVDGIQGAQVLLGQTDLVITESLINESIGAYNKVLAAASYISGAINTINGAIKRGFIKSKAIKALAICDNLIGLPYISDPILDIGLDREAITNQLAAVSEEFEGLLKRVSGEFDLGFDKSLMARSNVLLIQMKKNGYVGTINTEYLAFRELLGRLTSTVFRGSDKLKQVAMTKFVASGVFADVTQLRAHIYQRKYFMFSSPFNTKHEKTVYLTGSQTDVVKLIDELLLAEIDTHDKQLLWLTRASILLSGLPNELSSAPFKTKMIAEHADKRFINELNFDVIERSTAQALIASSYRASIAGLEYRLNKKSFRVTRSLSPYLKQSLIYVPKHQDWKVPTQMFDGRYSDILSGSDVVWSEAGVMSCAETVKKIAAINKAQRADIHLAFLREIPHRFFVQTGVTGLGVTDYGLRINAGEIQSHGELSTLVHVALSRNNTQLIKAINSLFEGAKVSPPSIQFTRHYKIDGAELIEIADKRQINFQMPTTLVGEVSDDRQWRPTSVLGIDPGEYGFGLALLDIKTCDVKDAAFCHINSLINYGNKKASHQSRTQPRQQYKAPYSNHLSNAADAAAGDICHIIDRLMVDFNAIPVFEMIDSKAENQNVWKAVIAKYTFGENDAQNGARKQHWFSASGWETNLLRLAPTQKKAKPFVAQPGFKVSSYGNSYKCSDCDRNAMFAIKEMADGRNIEIKNSTIELHDGMASFQLPTKGLAAPKNERNPLWLSIPDKIFKKVKPSSTSHKELAAIVRRSVRRAPTYKTATRGTRSVFKCPYNDCCTTMDADANAAINVANRAIEQLIIAPD